MARAHGSTTEECCICFRFTKQVKRVNRYAINVFISYCMMMAGDGVHERIIREVVRKPQGPLCFVATRFTPLHSSSKNLIISSIIQILTIMHKKYVIFASQCL